MANGDVIYNPERINQLINEMRGLIETFPDLQIPTSIQGECRSKLEEITQEYSNIFSSFSTELVDKLASYSITKSNDIVSADN